MDLLFLIGAVQSFFFATLLFSRTQIVFYHKILIAFFFLNGLLLLDHFLELKGIVFDHPHLLGLTYTLPLMTGPILYYYTIALTEEKRSSVPISFYKHSIPFVLLTGYFLFDYYFLSAEEKLGYYYRETEGKTSIMVYITEVCLNVSLPAYSVLSLICLKDHLRKIKNKFSYIENISLRWLAVILFLFGLISGVVLLTNIFSDIIPIFSFTVGDSLMYGSLVFVIFFIGYYGIKQKAIYSESQDETMFETNAKYQRSGLRMTENDPNLARLLTMMETEKLYRNSKLSLKELAVSMNFTENNLSQLINNGLGKSFYDFINEYRVNEVIEVIKSKQLEHLTLLGIAFESGFNSKSSFNSIFKQKTGMTPSEFKKSNS
jgi:AraC-like DNA-binding protein